jgi:predicted transcriptional regulator of viral defense system
MMKNRNNLLKRLLETGLRIFDISSFKNVAKELDYKEGSVRQILLSMRKDECIHLIRPGLYHIDNNFLSSPISAYEIGLLLVDNGCITHLSAATLHNLSDQLANLIYVSTPKQKKSFNQNSKIYGMRYKILHVKEKLIFGKEDKWSGDAKIVVTDLERTLIDCLNKPAYAGGFMEVIYYFEKSADNIDIEKIISYAKVFGNSCLQRLGWCLDKINKLPNDNLSSLIKKDFNTTVKLDSSGLRKGKYNKKWLVIENI